MKMIAYMAPTGSGAINLECVRSNYRLKRGETFVSWDLKGSTWKVGLRGCLCPDDPRYQEIKRLVPDVKADMDRMDAEAELLERSVRDAIRATAIGLRHEGVEGRGVESYLKEKLLERLASRRTLERLRP